MSSSSRMRNRIVSVIAAAAFPLLAHAQAPTPPAEPGAGTAVLPVLAAPAPMPSPLATPATPATPVAAIAVPVTAADHLRAARRWGYQLVELEPARLAATETDVLVIDYARDGSADTELTVADLERLRRRPDGGRRIVLAYLSIGEAESYRFYWNRWWSDLWFIPNPFGPSWRGPQNGDWGGNYAVRYWDPAWQAIVLGAPQQPGYMDRIIRAGFDGVWLDKVDSAIEDIAASRPSAKADMIAFVAKIAAKGREVRPGFLVVPQNAEELLPDPAYRALIDGIGKESLLFGEDGQNRANKPKSVEARTAWLKSLTAEGKPVLAVEYVNEPEKIETAKRDLTALGFVPLIAVRDLDLLPGDTTRAASAAFRKARGGPDAGAREPDPRRWWVVGVAAALLVFGLLVRRRRT